MHGHIDGFGRRKDRRGVALIQRLQGSAARKAKAQEKRDRRAAKRARLVEREAPDV